MTFRPSSPHAGDARVHSIQVNLPNCTWYRASACCVRTEVVSAFDQMPPLQGASTGCRNRVNYMMCHFCSPQQNIWYTAGRVQMCSSFCSDTYNECEDALFNGTKVGTLYADGKSFCEAQNFVSVSSTSRCFDFDEEAFDGAGRATSSLVLLAIVAIVKFI